MDNKKTIKSTSWWQRLFGSWHTEPENKKQLIALLRELKTNQLFDTEALHMLEGVLAVSETQVRDIMIPRAQMVVVDIDKPLTEILPIIIQSGHSRFPVIGESRDEIIGLLLAKDLLQYTAPNRQEKPFKIQDVLRPALFIPESKRLNVLLKELRLRHNHMAIVVDEYGGIAGLITIEDVLEQIVGEIEDEYDINEEDNIKKLYENYYTIKALTPIEDFNEYFKVNFSDEEFDTIGGLVLQQFGCLPKKGDSVTIDKFQFKVLHADNRRIRLLALTSTANQ